MFNGNGRLTLDGDHLDISYRDPDSWPSLTPKGSIKSFTFDIGDPMVGPVVQLGLIAPVDGEELDWAHSIDPPHYHGSDQFRVVSKGQWELANHVMGPGSFSFQEAGLRYREHPGGDGSAWMMLVIGDRRGARPTILRQADQEQLINTGSVNDRPLAGGENYPHPAGPRGIAAIATSAGDNQRGYVLGEISELTADAARAGAAGLFGDADAGPAALMINGKAASTVLPASHCDSERLLVITGGSCQIGDRQYTAGELRVQAEKTVLPDVTAGSEGVQMAVVIADRRAAATADTNLPWLADLKKLQSRISP